MNILTEDYCRVSSAWAHSCPNNALEFKVADWNDVLSKFEEIGGEKSNMKGLWHRVAGRGRSLLNMTPSAPKRKGLLRDSSS